MNALTGLLLVVAAATPPLAYAPQPDGSLVITLSAETVKACKDGGGCSIMTRDEFNQSVQDMKADLCGLKTI